MQLPVAGSRPFRPHTTECHRGCRLSQRRQAHNFCLRGHGDSPRFPTQVELWRRADAISAPHSLRVGRAFSDPYPSHPLPPPRQWQVVAGFCLCMSTRARASSLTSLPPSWHFQKPAASPSASSSSSVQVRSICARICPVLPSERSLCLRARMSMTRPAHARAGCCTELMNVIM